jgi:hypothetical protein
MHPLTEDSPPYFIRGGSLHPDGIHLFYGANFDLPRKADRVRPGFIVKTCRLVNGRPLPVRTAYSYGVSLNLQGTHLIYSRKRPPPSGAVTWTPTGT